MNQLQLQAVEELTRQQNELKTYIQQYEELGRKRDEIYRQCKHPLKFIYATDTDEHESRSYTKTMCMDCGTDWEKQSKYINKNEYFDHMIIECNMENINKLIQIRDKYGVSDPDLFHRLDQMIKQLFETLRSKPTGGEV